jgi:hypothetical protein
MNLQQLTDEQLDLEHESRYEALRALKKQHDAAKSYWHEAYQEKRAREEAAIVEQKVAERLAMLEANK